MKGESLQVFKPRTLSNKGNVYLFNLNNNNDYTTYKIRIKNNKTVIKAKKLFKFYQSKNY